MPVYEWVCDKDGCGYVREACVPVSDRDTEQICVNCHSIMRRSIGNNGGFRLGGGNVGWGSTGYATTLGDAEKFESL